MKLKELRQAKGMTRTQLSKAIDIPERTIARWENSRPICIYKRRSNCQSFLK